MYVYGFIEFYICNITAVQHSFELLIICICNTMTVFSDDFSYTYLRSASLTIQSIGALRVIPTEVSFSQYIRSFSFYCYQSPRRFKNGRSDEIDEKKKRSY